MYKDILLSLEIAAVYMGAVIGAGFATGQEIYHFFARFGFMGLIGTLIAGLLFACYGSFVLLTASRYRCSNYRELLNILMGRKIAAFLDVISLSILFGGIGIMLAGSGAVFEEQMGLNAGLGILISLLFSCLIVLKGLQGLLAANSILVPVKFIIAITVSGAALYFFKENPDYNFVHSCQWFSCLNSTILYVSYNLVIPLAVLSSLGRIASRKAALCGGILGGVGLGAAAYLIAAAEICFYPEIQNCQIPLLYVASKLHPFYSVFLSLLIWAAILTTLISNTHGIASRLASESSVKYKVVGISVLFLTLPLAKFEFAFLVKLLYPLFGYAGMVLVLYLSVKILYELKEKLTKRNI